LQSIQREIIVPTMSKHNGRIIRMMGDGSLFAFDSALSAVQFAVSVQRTVAERKSANQGEVLQLRMGAELCDIILGDDDVHGEGVNIAVRLEELAPAGGICLSHSIYLQTKTALGNQLLPIGERQLKNISEPVQVWRWQPPGVSDGVGATLDTAHKKKHFYGRQILDPKVTSVIVNLHIRSTFLAISDCIDEIIATSDAGTSMSLEELFRSFGGHLNHAHGILRAISVELVDDMHELVLGLWQPQQSMSEFAAAVFDNANTSLAARLLPAIQDILRSDVAGAERRMQIMTLIRNTIDEELAPHMKSLIKFAFVDA
jgi:hypothetical protein